MNSDTAFELGCPSSPTHLTVAFPKNRWIAARKQRARLEDSRYERFHLAFRGTGPRDVAQRILPGVATWPRTRFEDIGRELGVPLGEAAEPPPELLAPPR